MTPDLSGILEFEMTLQSLTQLQAIIRKVESISSVLKVERMSTHRMRDWGHLTTPPRSMCPH